MFVWLTYAVWLLLVVYLTVTAFGAKRDSETHLGQSFALLFALVAAFLLPRVPMFGFVNFTRPPVIAGVGLALDVVGSLFLVWGRQTLGSNWSQTVAAKEGHELITSGPYAIVRNPMYAGGLLAGVGAAIAAGGSWVFMVLLLGGLFLWRVRAEDDLMARQFPNEYPAYRKRTKALIPFVW
jgi:protein-S-isoprenylcysteine O-methyltransferase